MATCKLCDNSGWFFKVDKDGLCRTCAPIWSSTVAQAVRVINESLEIARGTKSLGTLISRSRLAIEQCRTLRRYEQRGLTSTDPAPSQFLNHLEAEREKALLEWLDAEIIKVRAKSQAATTPAAKTRPFSKLLEAFTDIYAELDDVTKIETRELMIRHEMDALRLDIELDKAERLAFKGQRKRALDAYLDALYLLRKDSIPDNRQQAEVSRIESKIRELGGEVPS